MIIPTATLQAACNPEPVALERQLEAESAILIKNDDNLLPLQKNVKVCFGSKNNTTPNNWGDPLLQYEYVMRYGASPDFVYDTLVLPRVDKEVSVEERGSTVTGVRSFVETKAGEPFNAYFLMWNYGEDGITTAQIKVDGEVVAEKIMAINLVE